MRDFTSLSDWIHAWGIYNGVAINRQFAPLALLQLSRDLARFCHRELIRLALSPDACIVGREAGSATAYEGGSLCVYVLRWGPGAGVEWHDHGDADAAVAVVRGRVENAVCDSHGIVHTRVLSAGRALLLRAPGTHRMGFGPEPRGVSVHAYSGPSGGLERMSFYASDAATGRPVLSRVVDRWTRTGAAVAPVAH